MSGKRSLTNPHINSVFAENSVEELEAKLKPDTTDLPKAIPPSAKVNSKRIARTWEAIGQTPDSNLLDPWTEENLEAFSGNIENCIGSTKVPLGIAGPLRVKGLFANGDYPIPLATTEAALVASYHRGACLLTAAGGCTSMLLNQAVNRNPVFVFESLPEACHFVSWAKDQMDSFRSTTEETTNFGKLMDFGTTVEGNHVYLNFEFTTGDASGQNMVTIATENICQYIEKECPIPIKKIYVEGNASGDKKASAQAFTAVRGRKVSAEAVLPREMV